MTELIYWPDAVTDIRSAFEWYEQKRSGLGDEFPEELLAAEQRLEESPTAFRVIHRDARRYLLRRFP